MKFSKMTRLKIIISHLLRAEEICIFVNESISFYGAMSSMKLIVIQSMHFHVWITSINERNSIHTPIDTGK